MSVVRPTFQGEGTRAPLTPGGRPCYGSMVSRPSYFKMLDPVQHQALCLCFNAFRTTPVDSLHVKANEMPLDLRTLKIAMQYAIKLLANPRNPAYSVVFTPNFNRSSSTHLMLPLHSDFEHLDFTFKQPESTLSSLVINRCQKAKVALETTKHQPCPRLYQKALLLRTNIGLFSVS